MIIKGGKVMGVNTITDGPYIWIPFCTINEG